MQQEGEQTSTALKADFADIFKVPVQGGSSADVGAVVGGALGGGTAQKPQAKGVGTPVGGRGAGNPAAQMLQQWREALDQRLIAEQKFFGDSKGEELAYWQGKLADIKSGAAGVNAATKEGAALQLEVERQVYALQKSESQQWISDYKAGIEQQLEALKQSLSQREISETEYYARSKALAQEWADVVAQTYGKNTQQYAAALKQLDALDRQHAAQSGAVWKQTGDIIKNDFDQMLTGMLRGTETFQQAFARLAENLVISMIEARAKIVVDWAVGQVEKLTETETTNTAIVASDAAQAAASNAAKNAVDVKPSILKHAGSAAAAVYDDVAQIPFVGWLLAPAAAAAAFAAVAAFSAEGGLYEVPGTVLSVLHAQETVLPAGVAGPMRDFFASGGLAGAPGAGAAGGVTVLVAPSFSVQAWNGQDAVNALKSQGRVIAQIIADQISSGNSSLRSAMAKT